MDDQETYGEERLTQRQKKRRLFADNFSGRFGNLWLAKISTALVAMVTILFFDFF